MVAYLGHFGQAHGLKGIGQLGSIDGWQVVPSKEYLFKNGTN